MTIYTSPFEVNGYTPQVRRNGGRTVEQPATEKQVAFIKRLAAERNMAFETDGLTKRLASQAIDNLMTIPKPARQESSAIVEEAPEGFHEVQGSIFKVQVAHHGSGRKYAKQLDLDSGEWEYVGRKPLAFLSSQTMLTLDRAKELGHLYGRCVRCGATLTNEASIEAGIGPICAGKF
jgi:hypothetical protein